MQLKPGYVGDQQELRLEAGQTGDGQKCSEDQGNKCNGLEVIPSKRKFWNRCNAFLLTPIQIRTSPGGMGVQGLDTGQTPSGARVRNRKESGWDGRV